MNLRRLVMMLFFVLMLLGMNLRHIRSLAVTLLSDDYQAHAAPAAPSGGDVKIELTARATGFEQPTELGFVPGQPERLLVLERTGALTWLDLAADRRGTLAEFDVVTRSEQGLLGLAFHPEFVTNGRFFVQYSVKGDRSLIEEWRVPAGEDVATARATAHHVVLEVEQPYPNHNGGQLLFGPDGHLYVPMGDGGFKDDIHGHGQNRETLLGNILRLDVDSAEPYAVPKDNPFVGVDGVLPEIWAYGLRNPWRTTFDPQGRMVVADVGQNAWEEVAFASSGANLGWNRTEGNACFQADCSFEGTRGAMWAYGRGQGTSITGGVVYRGSVKELANHYVFGDFVSGRLWAMPLPSDLDAKVDAKSVRSLGKWDLNAATFATAPDGVLWIADFGRGRLMTLGAP